MDDAMDDYPRRLCCGTRIFMLMPWMIIQGDHVAVQDFHG